MVQYNRRHFLQGAAGAVALTLLPQVARADVNSKIRMATIGFNGRGKSHIDGFGPKTWSRFAIAIATCSASGPANSNGKHGRKLDQVVDFRELLGSQGHRRDFDRHAESHALADRDRGRRGRQARVLREAGEPVRVGRAADRQRLAAVRSNHSVRHAGALERLQSARRSSTSTAASSARSSTSSAPATSRGRASASSTSRW